MIIIYIIAVISGLAFSYLQDSYNITSLPGYQTVIYTVLAIGLYGSTYHINKKELNPNKHIILQAITIGVLAKIILIGWLLFEFTHNPLSFLLGVSVAQIDPLSVARQVNNKETRLSVKAQTILSTWSSFDDPITVIASAYMSSFLSMRQHATQGSQYIDIYVYILDIVTSFILAASIFALNKLVRLSTRMQYFLLLSSSTIAVWLQAMLAIAAIGLFLRPRLNSILPWPVEIAYCISLFILGTLLINGLEIVKGALLALSAVIAQVLVSLVLTRNLVKRDRIHLSLSQQNGITAITLALLLEISYPGMVSVIAPAILFINLTHLIMNKLGDIYLNYTDSLDTYPYNSDMRGNEENKPR